MKEKGHTCRQAGFTPVFVLVGFLVLIGIVATGYFLFRTQKPSLTSQVPSQSASPSATEDKTANWIVYENTTYGYSFKYPPKNQLPLGLSDYEPKTNPLNPIWIQKQVWHTGVRSKGGEDEIFYVTVATGGINEQIEGDKKSNCNRGVEPFVFIGAKPVVVAGIEGVETICKNAITNQETGGLYVQKGGYVYIFGGDSEILSTFKFIANSTHPVAIKPGQGPLSSQKIDSTNWTAYTNTRLNYRLKYPKEWTTSPPDPQGAIQFYRNGQAVLGVYFTSQDIMNLIGKSYCETYPTEKPRCEQIIVDGRPATIDWGKGTTSQVLVRMSLTIGVLDFSLFDMTEQGKATLIEILSTFKFLD